MIIYALPTNKVWQGSKIHRIFKTINQWCNGIKFCLPITMNKWILYWCLIYFYFSSFCIIEYRFGDVFILPFLCGFSCRLFDKTRRPSLGTFIVTCLFLRFGREGLYFSWCGFNGWLGGSFRPVFLGGWDGFCIFVGGRQVVMGIASCAFKCED